MALQQKKQSHVAIQRSLHKLQHAPCYGPIPVSTDIVPATT